MSKQDELTSGKGKDRKGVGKKTEFSGFRRLHEELRRPITNDPAYYFKYPKLAELAAKLPFNHRNGSKIPALYENGAASSSFNYNIDGIAIQPIMMTPGMCLGTDSGINTASQAAWKMLNRRFRGVSKYATPDFGIIQFGIVDFAANLSSAERIYGLLNYFSVNNLTVPNQLLYAMGVDPSSFVDLADYRLKLNRLILRAKTLCLVRGYSLLDHALFLTGNLFKDKNCARAQLIVPVLQGYWKYTGTRFDTGSALEWIPYKSVRTIGAGGTHHVCRSMTEIMADLDAQLDALLQDDDVDNVCSDILAFYGNKEDAAEIVKFSQIPEEYLVTPIYSIEFLHQWHNANLLPSVVNVTGSLAVGTCYSTDIESSITDSGSGDIFIYQYQNVIKFNLHWIGTGTPVSTTSGGMVQKWSGNGNTGYFSVTRIIDTDVDQPAVQDIMEITRYTTTVKPQATTISGSNCSRLDVSAMSSFIFFQLRVWVFKQAGDNPTLSGTTYTFANLITAVHSGNSSNIDHAISRFDWFPICMNYGGMGTVHYVGGDLDNYTAITAEILGPMHDVALLSEFKNPITDLLLKED